MLFLLKLYFNAKDSLGDIGFHCSINSEKDSILYFGSNDIGQFYEYLTNHLLLQPLKFTLALNSNTG